MKTLNATLSDFTSETPTQAGTYLWRNSLGVELINVRVVPERVEYGIQWDEYLAYGCRGDNVGELSGKFLKLNIEN